MTGVVKNNTLRRRVQRLGRDIARAMGHDDQHCKLYARHFVTLWFNPETADAAYKLAVESHPFARKARQLHMRHRRAINSTPAFWRTIVSPRRYQ